MKPDKPGEWHSRDGRRILVYIATTTVTLRWMICDKFSVDSKLISDLDGDDWLPAEPPKFPELPTKPKLVLADLKNWWPCGIHWFIFSDGTFWRVCGEWWWPHKLTVIPHPDNDPEAVRLIEEAQA